MKQKLHDADYWINRPMDSPKDWVDDQPNWLESYVHSAYHPHRQLILNAIKEFPVRNILEIGCGTGSNLLRIHEVFPNIKLAGIDVSKKCIDRASDYLENAIFKVGSYLAIPFGSKSFDVVLADATLMYCALEDINGAMEEIDRISRGVIIIVDRMSKSREGIISGHVWARNYPALLRDLGYKVKTTKITEKDWPNSKGWVKQGIILVARKEENYLLGSPSFYEVGEGLRWV